MITNPNRAARRAHLQRRGTTKTSNATRKALESLQRRQLARWMVDDTEAIAAQAERIARVRTLKYDEAAKAHTPSQGAIMAAAAVWNEHTVCAEDVAGYLIPRKSRTEQLYLRLFPPVFEMRDIPFRVLDKASRDRLAAAWHEIRRVHPIHRAAYAEKLIASIPLVWISGSNPALAWKSDTTLLATRKGFDSFERIRFQRVTSKSKERKIEKESASLPTWDADETPTD